VEANGTRLDEERFPGRQGRIVFAYLAVHKGRAVPRGELADVIWGEDLPATWEKALRVLMTKLRALLEECGIDRTTGLTSAFGCYTLTLPATTWIDVDAAKAAIQRAEAALAAGALNDARDHASAAAGLSRRIFLPGEDGSWVEEQRRDLRDTLVQAIECLRDVSLSAGNFGAAVRYAAEITELEPFRESSYRALMQAHVGAGNPAEALRAYERCRRFLADELGAYPSAESEAVYLQILRSSSEIPTGRVDPGEEPGPDAESPPPPAVEPPRRSRRKTMALAIALLLVGGFATAARLGLSARDSASPRILPNSLVRLDPRTLKPTKVVPIGPKADLVIAAGGYVWITHGILRYTHNDRLRNAGDNTLTRFDPSTDEVRTVGRVAPCGIASDPSGDLWVANCYPPGEAANVVHVDARTLQFGQPSKVPAGAGYYRGMAYGAGSLWVGGVCCQDGHLDRRLAQLDPETGTTRNIRLKRPAVALAWSDGYGDLWMTNAGGTASRMDATTEDITPTPVTSAPSPLAVDHGVVWVGDWMAPRVTRLHADGTARPHRIPLRVPPHTGGVTAIAAGGGAIWVTVPDIHALIRIDPKTDRQRKIPLRYAPWGVAVDDRGAIWVTLRSSRTFNCALANC
jgi:DNA-binding SARP family transcriptional activator/streptogramin lyase